MTAAGDVEPLGMTPAADAAGALVRWSAGADSAEGLFRFEASLPVLAGHFPGAPLVPGVHLLAAAGQLVSRARPGMPGSPAAIERVRWTRPVRPGEEVAVAVRWRREGGAVLVDATLRVGEQAVAQARLRYAS